MARTLWGLGAAQEVVAENNKTEAVRRHSSWAWTQQPVCPGGVGAPAVAPGLGGLGRMTPFQHAAVRSKSVSAPSPARSGSKSLTLNVVPRCICSELKVVFSLGLMCTSSAS